VFRFRLLALLIFTSAIVAGQQIPIQFALTDTAGIELENRTVDVKATLTSDTTSFTPEYQETQSVTTNDFGIASFWIGEGNTTLSSSNSSINTNWLNPNTDYFIVLQVDSTGLGYNDLATISYQLPLVAVKSNNSDTASFADTSGYSINIDPRAFSDSSAINEIQSLGEVLSVDSNASGKTIYNLNNLTIGDTIRPSAALAINRTDAGLLLPRLTKIQRNGIVNPEKGLIVYCTDCVNEGRVSVYDGNTWELLSQTNSTGSYAVISAGPVQNITVSGATFNGSISDSGGTTVFAKGFCLSSQPYPSLADVVIAPTLMDSSGVFKGRADYLDRNSKYYLRAYATNAAGTVYGPQQEFLTSGLLAVGDTFGGGIVAYLFEIGDFRYSQSDQHGIIIMENDFPNQRSFGPSYCFNNTLYYNTYPDLNNLNFFDTTATSQRIGDALYNHNLLMTQTSACYLQNNLIHAIDTISWNGFDDWYLPTSEDLRVILESLISEGLQTSNYALLDHHFSSSTDGTWQNNYGTDTKGVKTWTMTVSQASYPDFITTYYRSSLNSSYQQVRRIRLIRYF
jgi:hypothetical protein